MDANVKCTDYQYLLSQKNKDLPYVISNSYGDHENTVPEKYAKRVCNMIGMMGMRGRTILESSGDEGVGAVCRSNTGDMHPEFTPQFPGTCPYVTAVGGTQFVNPEVAWNASSGGFSFYFPAPGYQKSAVKTYLNDYIQHLQASVVAYFPWVHWAFCIFKTWKSSRESPSPPKVLTGRSSALIQINGAIAELSRKRSRKGKAKVFVVEDDVA